MLDRNALLQIISGRQRGGWASLVRAGLWCLIPFYRFAVYLKNRRYDSSRLDRAVNIPVISVGNLTTGGTGKTPMVIWLAKYFQNHNKVVTILSRGYGRGKNTTNDEAAEIEQQLPNLLHLQNPNRVASAKLAVAQHGAEIIVLDDGFQHRRMNRDLDIVLIDATNPFGYEYLLPRGLLREPITSLARADVIIVTRCEQVTEDVLVDICNRVRVAKPDASIASTVTQPSNWIQHSGREFDLKKLEQQRVVAMSAIGNPASFYHLVNSLGCHVEANLTFPDHHQFSHKDLDQVSRKAKEVNAQAIVCTHKDLVKIAVDDLNGIPVYALQIELQFQSGESMVRDQLRTLIAG